MEDIRIIYRHYATLYFVFIVDEQESELGISDLIQVFVESLNHCLENVCELDLVFGWQVMQTVLGEIVQGGMVVETNINKIMAAIDRANNIKSTDHFSDGSGVQAAGNAIRDSAQKQSPLHRLLSRQWLGMAAFGQADKQKLQARVSGVKMTWFAESLQDISEYFEIESIWASMFTE